MSNRRKVRTRPLPFGPEIHLTDDDGQVIDSFQLSFPPHLVTAELRRLVLADPDEALAAYMDLVATPYLLLTEEDTPMTTTTSDRPHAVRCHACESGHHERCRTTVWIANPTGGSRVIPCQCDHAGADA